MFFVYPLFVCGYGSDVLVFFVLAFSLFLSAVIFSCLRSSFCAMASLLRVISVHMCSVGVIAISFSHSDYCD